MHVEVKTQHAFFCFYLNNTAVKAKIAGNACTKNIFLEAESAP